MNFKENLIEYLKKFMQFCLMIIRSTKTFLIQFFNKLPGFAKKVYAVCDSAMGKMVNFFQATYQKKRKRNPRKFYTIIYLIISLCIVAVIAFAMSFYFFVIPVGSNGVVTRFGAYNREVDSGLHYRFPFIERYYIVDTYNLMEETFGFIQPNTPEEDPGMTPEERYVLQYDATITNAERDMGNFFSNRGNILDSLNQRQRLPHDYLRKKFFPKKGTTQLAQLAATNKNIPPASRIVPNYDEMKMVTADLNIIYITWSLQYKIKDARQYLFNSRDVVRNIRDIGQSMMNETVGDTLFMDLISTGREKVEAAVTKKTQKWLDDYGVGILVSKVIILDALPPKEVIHAFNEVNNAAQEMERMIYEAEIGYLTVIPEAYGEADRLKLDAKAYAVKIINEAMGEAGRFSSILNQYSLYPQITNDRLYIEAMSALFNKVPNTIVDSKVNALLPILLGNPDQKNKASTNMTEKLMSPSLMPAPNSTPPAVSPAPTTAPTSAVQPSVTTVQP